MYNNKIKEAILIKDFSSLWDYNSWGDFAKLSVPTPEHLNPLFYILGTIEPEDEIEFFNDEFDLGSLSMTSFKVGA